MDQMEKALRDECDKCARLERRIALMRDVIEIELGLAETRHDNVAADRIRIGMLRAESDMDEEGRG